MTSTAPLTLRRARFRAGLLLGLLLCGSAVAAAVWQHPGEPAAMFRGGPARTGVYEASGAPAFGGVRWRVRTDGPVRSSPAVAGGRVYFGSADGYVYAAGLDGRLAWKTPVGAAVTASPAVSGGRVFIQTRTGEVLALSAADGAVAWRQPTGADLPFDWGHESGDVYHSSPAVVDGLVLVGSGDGHLYALEEARGRVRWRFRTGGRVRSSPAAAGGVAYVGSMDGSLYAVDLGDGALRWRFDTLGRTLRSADFGFDRKSVQSSPAVVGDAVYFGARDGILYAVDARTGKARWRFDHDVSWVNTSPAVWDGLVFAGSSDATFIQAVDARTGEERWRVKTSAPVWSSPAVAEGVLYVGDGGGTLHALDARTGARRWAARLGNGIQGTPVPVDGMVLAGSLDGHLYAVGGEPGGALRRIVYWDSTYAHAAWQAGHDELRDYLAARGYEPQGAAALAATLRDATRVRDAGRTVVVFSMDHLPAELDGEAGRGALLRAFLEAGGKVVWTGIPPLLMPRDPATGDFAGIKAIDRAAAGALLGVDFSPSNFDRSGAAATPAGEAWGLHGWWQAPWSVAPGSVSEVLARDENDLASAWVKRYGGPAGTGFVMIGRGSAAWTDPGLVLAAADYRP